MTGISICIVTYNSLFYNRLAVEKIREFTRVVDYEILFYDNGSTDGSVEWLGEQDDVTLFRGKNNDLKHGKALDFLVRRARFPITCTLCSDAFPVSPEWLTPAMYLDEKIGLAGIRKPSNRLTNYVCPSYLFGWTEWIKRYSFIDNWPKWDTGEKLAKDLLDKGLEVKTWNSTMVDIVDQIRSKKCDYNGWVWHSWFSTRQKVVPNSQLECELGYDEIMKNILRERYNLDY